MATTIDKEIIVTELVRQFEQAWFKEDYYEAIAPFWQSEQELIQGSMAEYT